MKMRDKLFSFDDVLIVPKFSRVRSRKDVDVTTEFLGLTLSLPVMNANMDTVASPALCQALAAYGTVGTLHRFCSIEENIEMFKAATAPNFYRPIISVGLGDYEFERAKALFQIGGSRIMLDVAHAANIAVVEAYNRLVAEFGDAAYFIVGDFGNGEELEQFLEQVNRKPDAVKVGISVGSVCVTRLTTGVGTPALTCLQSCSAVASERGIKVVLDGGVRYWGDFAKALIAGADVIITGSLFAGTDEAPGVRVNKDAAKRDDGQFKEYRGSASAMSYAIQNKVAPWRTPEGRETVVPYTGAALDVLNNINGGIRSACSYVDALNLEELKVNGEFRYIG